MNILLINSNLSSDVKIHAHALPNIGLAYLIAAIELKHVVRLIDTTFYVKKYQEYILEKIKDFSPDVVGFSTTTFNFQNSLKIAQFIKEVIPNPNIPFVWGGIHPTLASEEALSEALVDAVCIGEGEISFLAYLDQIQAGQQPYEVEGIWFKDKQKNIVKNKLRPFIQDLDSLPFPAWEHFETEKYLEFSRRGFMFLASRGCPYQCTFCSSPSVGKLIPGKYHRTRNPESLFTEIKVFQEKYSNGKFEHIYFGDETFGLNVQQFKGICERFQQEETLQEVTWSCETRADIITQEWARLASESRCTMVKLGIESGDEYIRNQVYKKNITDDDIKNAIKYLRQYKIEYIFLMLLGSYQESKASIKRNLELLKISAPLSYYIFIYCPTPGTELYDVTKKALLNSHILKKWDKNELPTPVLLLPLHRIIWRFRILKLSLFLKHGFRLRGLHFIFDIVFVFMSWMLLRGIDLKVKFKSLQRSLEKYILIKRDT